MFVRGLFLLSLCCVAFQQDTSSLTDKRQTSNSGTCYRSRWRTLYRTTYTSVSATETYRCWLRRCSRTVYSSRSRSSPYTSYYREAYCCSGYLGSPPNCYPICRPNCAHGRCVAPNRCTCNSGWGGPNCNTPICDPNCVNGRCVAPNECECPDGWSGPACSCSVEVCVPSCVNGVCVDEECYCPREWTGERCSDPVCYAPNGCGSHGVCIAPNHCHCNPNYEGSRCERYTGK